MDYFQVHIVHQFFYTQDLIFPGYQLRLVTYRFLNKRVLSYSSLELELLEPGKSIWKLGIIFIDLHLVVKFKKKTEIKVKQKCLPLHKLQCLPLYG